MGCTRSKLVKGARDEPLGGGGRAGKDGKRDAADEAKRRKVRSGSLTGEAMYQRELSTLNEAMVQLHLNEDIRKVYDGLQHPKRKKAAAPAGSAGASEEDGWLGSGNWGQVRVVTRRDDKRKFACKILRLSKNMTPHRRQELLDEILVLSKLDHPHIAKLYETYEEEGLNLYLIMELLEGGELFKRLTVDSHKGRFTEVDARNTTRQMVSAIAYLHSRGIVHRDLKLENFVYREQGGSDLVLIDFGLSVKYKSSGRATDQMHDIVGSSYYIAPEVLKKNYGVECDIWSLGVIVYMLLSGTPPFKGETEQKIMASALRGVYSMSRPVWKTLTEEAKDFVRKCLVINVKRRMTARDALDHPWFRMELANDASEAEASSISSDSSSTIVNDGIIKNLRQYAHQASFTRIALQAVSYELSRDDIKDLENAFKVLDRDGDGYITSEELQQELTSHNKMSNSECHEIFQAMDFDRTGKVHFNEFVAAALSLSFDHDETILQHAFSRLDLDNDGLVDVEQIRSRFGSHLKDEDGKYASKVLEEVIKRNSMRGLDGKITIKDFMAIVREGHDDEIAQVPSRSMDLSELGMDADADGMSLHSEGADLTEVDDSSHDGLDDSQRSLTTGALVSHVSNENTIDADDEGTVNNINNNNNNNSNNSINTDNNNNNGRGTVGAENATTGSVDPTSPPKVPTQAGETTSSGDPVAPQRLKSVEPPAPLADDGERPFSIVVSDALQIQVPSMMGALQSDAIADALSRGDSLLRIPDASISAAALTQVHAHLYGRDIACASFQDAVDLLRAAQTLRMHFLGTAALGSVRLLTKPENALEALNWIQRFGTGEELEQCRVETLASVEILRVPEHVKSFEDLALIKWAKSTPLPAPLHSMGVFGISGPDEQCRIIVAGGRSSSGKDLADVMQFCLEADSASGWQRMPLELPECRSSFGYTIVDAGAELCLLVAGGVSGSRVLDSVIALVLDFRTTITTPTTTMTPKKY
ncbi:Protein kinase, putative [Hondaea fermentalgiana]|uniref:Protein kinase, putative n=1 Tax=Hondaea fermentalgiana TaxID=2315210 RepID=A0A2R5GFQ2_9STRA|nr:Protein kinase, putative [Hondaea fermentalgiana]|eukprot:GBG27071.1 Protein kinase, putative [Hondaea fermentalgiana]